MDGNYNKQIEALKSAIKELPYKEGKAVRERSVYFFSRISTGFEIILSTFFILLGLVCIMGDIYRILFGLVLLIYGLWRITKYFQRAGTRKPACIITDTNIEYMDKVYEWRNVTNARTYKLSGGKYGRTKYYVSFKHNGEGVEINISKLDTSIPSFLFQLYSHKLNYHLRYGISEADFEPEVD